MDLSKKDLEIMQKAQSGLFKMLQEPDKLKELLSNEHVSNLLEQLEENSK